MQTSDYLEQLVQDRDDLVDNLTTKGITGLTGDETFTELVPQVLDIPSGGDISEFINGNAQGGQLSNLSLGYWFETIKKITNINLPSNVTSLSYFFKEFRGTSVDVLSWNTQNITSMDNLFFRCRNLTTLDLSNFNTENVTTMLVMFANCSNLTTLDLSNFNTERVTTLRQMFAGCLKLTSLNLSSFKSTVVNSTYLMFSNCSMLNFLDMRNFDFTTVNEYQQMFDNANTSCLIVVKDQTQKDWFTTNYPTMTNVQTVAEYEASLNE